MKLKFIDGSIYKKKIKCTIQQTGKLGFSQDAIAYFKLNEIKYVGFAINEEDKKDTNLYMSIFNKEEEKAFKVVKAGNYFYINTIKLFDELGLDYQNKIFIFDITEMEYEGKKIYKLIRRESDRKQK